MLCIFFLLNEYTISNFHEQAKQPPLPCLYIFLLIFFSLAKSVFHCHNSVDIVCWVLNRVLSYSYLNTKVTLLTSFTPHLHLMCALAYWFCTHTGHNHKVINLYGKKRPWFITLLLSFWPHVVFEGRGGDHNPGVGAELRHIRIY